MCATGSHCIVFLCKSTQVTSPTYKTVISQSRMSVAFIPGICGALASPAWRRPTSGVSVADTLLFPWLQNYEGAFQALWVFQCCWGTQHWRTMVQPQGKSKADQTVWKKKTAGFIFKEWLFHPCYCLFLGLMLLSNVQLFLPTKALQKKKQSYSLLPH